VNVGVHLHAVLLALCRALPDARSLALSLSLSLSRTLDIPLYPLRSGLVYPRSILFLYQRTAPMSFFGQYGDSWYPRLHSLPHATIRDYPFLFLFPFDDTDIDDLNEPMTYLAEEACVQSFLGRTDFWNSITSNNSDCNTPGPFVVFFIAGGYGARV